MSNSIPKDMNPKAIRLKDYKPYLFSIPNIEIEFSILKSHVVVSTLMKVCPHIGSSSSIVLKGRDIELKSILIDGEKIDNLDYDLNNQELTIKKIPNKNFELRINSNINPFNNNSLEGLYLSSQMLVTQCEAEGFRRICFHPDRPDVLSKYDVSIEADIKKYPVLLSNGNKVLYERKGIRHKIKWSDPYPKPSYLFALVAGNLTEVNASFLTKSGKDVLIRLHVEQGDESYTKHALDSLRRAMVWDEKVYGFEYDLDEFNIVAVRHFNMGAMENKSLNIFNSKLVLADAVIATDQELERIESVIAHEYFHNWTGNRITCRDWFQLSLKEGLTVFRDQCFTSDMHSSSIKRIEDVSFLRNTQFKEDSGPTAHAVKPDKYISIDNFYTTTIYEKGAELIRMLSVLLGPKKFYAGISTYAERFDGSFATVEDFLNSIKDGSILSGEKLAFDINQFSLWYTQPGTPHVSVKRKVEESSGNLILEFHQYYLHKTPKNEFKPLVIPILMAEIDSDGKINKERLYILNASKQNLILKNEVSIESLPTISLFRGFSAPVLFETDYSDKEYLHLLRFDNDPFARWEAGQFLMRKSIMNRYYNNISNDLDNKLKNIFSEILLETQTENQLIISKLLSVPGISELEISHKKIDPLLLSFARDSFIAYLGEELVDPLQNLLERSKGDSIAKWPLGQHSRRNISLAWHLLSAGGDFDVLKEMLQAVDSDSMTLAKSALSALHQIECNERILAMNNFYSRWEKRPVILDTWFNFSASTPVDNSLEKIRELLVHPRFDKKAPNSVRAVLGGFASNYKLFHNKDGSGYEFMAEQIYELDKRNPITASRLAKVFVRWQDYSEPFSNNIYSVITKLSCMNLSSNTKEVIDLMINYD